MIERTTARERIKRLLSAGGAGVLSRDQRLALILAAAEGCSAAEIAAVLDVSETEARQLHARAMRIVLDRAISDGHRPLQLRPGAQRMRFMHGARAWVFCARTSRICIQPVETHPTRGAALRALAADLRACARRADYQAMETDAADAADEPRDGEATCD